MNKPKQQLSAAQISSLIQCLKKRFEHNKRGPKGIEWAQVQAKLEAAASQKLCSLQAMEDTGGEPELVAYDAQTDEYIFYDCSAESPKGRRSLCYDQEALHSRKEHPPEDSALNRAADMGIELLTEQQYREL